MQAIAYLNNTTLENQLKLISTYSYTSKVISELPITHFTKGIFEIQTHLKRKLIIFNNINPRGGRKMCRYQRRKWREHGLEMPYVRKTGQETSLIYQTPKNTEWC